ESTEAAAGPHIHTADSMTMKTIEQVQNPGSLPASATAEEIAGAVSYVLAGLLIGAALMALLYRHSRAFIRWLGVSQCFYCDQAPREGKFTCYKHAGFEEEQA